MIPGLDTLVREVADLPPDTEPYVVPPRGASPAALRAVWERNMLAMYGRVPTPQEQTAAYLDLLRDCGAL